MLSRRSSAASRARSSSSRRQPRADHVALAAAELVVVFGAHRARHRAALGAQGLGRLVGSGTRASRSTLVMWMVFVAYLLLRRFGGPGSRCWRRPSALFGMALVPFVYWSVNFWRTIHPTTDVVPTLPPAMAAPSSAGARSRSCCCTSRCCMRARAARAQPRGARAGVSRAGGLSDDATHDRRVIDARSARLAARLSRRRSRSPRSEPRRTSSCPCSRAPRQESLPATPLVFAAYAFVWVALARLRVRAVAPPRPRRARAGRRQRRRLGQAPSGR